MTPAARGTAVDGARVGAAIGVLALAIGLSAGGWWLPAAIPAGAVAGAWTGPRIIVGGAIRVRLVVAGAAIATVVGATVISAGLAVASRSISDGGPAAVLGAWSSATVLGLLTVGWLAMLVLLPVTAVAIAIVRARAARPNAARPPRSSAWLGGLVVGVASGSLALTFPVVGYEIALLFIVGALLARRTRAAIAGLALGAGIGWTALIANGIVSCRSDGCFPPDYAPWLAVGVGMLVVGVILSIVAVVRR
jgi:hypothetical protein